MPTTQIDQNTLVPVGVIAGVGISVWRIVVWFLNLKTKVDTHTSQIKEIKDEIKDGNVSRSILFEKVSKVEGTITGIDEKVNLLIKILNK